jgi:tetratricopeptide (TPR) repeat protein
MCFLGICQEAQGYTDIRDGTRINIYVDIDERTGNVSKQILLHHFLFFPTEMGESLDSEESFQTAAVIQSESADWSDFVKLIHFVPLAGDQMKDPKIQSAIKDWATKNGIITTVVANTDKVRLSEVGVKGTPLMHISLYDLKGKVREFDTADPRNPEDSPEAWKEKLFKLMGAYFDDHFRDDEVQDWVTWLRNMKKVLMQRNLFDRYLELGKDRLRKGNQGIDYRELPICEVPPPLSNEDSKRIDVAIEAFQGTIEEKPEEKTNEAEARNYLGNSYYRKRDYKNALSNFQEAVNLKGTEQTYLHNLVMAYWKLGNIQQAKATIERWLERHPDDERAKKIRKRLVGGTEVPPWIAALLLSGAALSDFGYTEVYPRTPHENASSALTSAQQISPEGATTSLSLAELQRQRNHWGDYQKFNRRATMLSLTAGNLLLNSVPFWLDALNRKSPMDKKGMSIAYGAKGAAFLAVALVYGRKAENAETDENDAKKSDLRQHFYGRRQQANETKRMLFYNAGIDAVTVIGLLLFYDPNDEAPGQGKSPQASNRFAPHLGFNVRSDGQNNREILVFVQKTF